MHRAFVRHRKRNTVTPGRLSTKALLRDFGIERAETRYNHSRNKVSRGEVNQLLSPPHGSESRGGGHGDFEKEMKDGVY